MEKLSNTYRIVEKCRICGGTSLVPYLDLGLIPLVNNYLKSSDLGKEEIKLPLKILYCAQCSLSELSIVVNPEILYRNYFYRSSVSRTFRDHCFAFAEECAKRFNLTKDDLIVDIASNDGCTLKEFKKFGVRVLGVDPAINLAKIANAEGIETLAEFWNEETAKMILNKFGKASIINAMNVFAHVDDLNPFLEGIQILLKDDGVFTIEVPYLLNFINKKEFDTSYHEHLSYFLVRPLTYLFKKYGMEIFDIKKLTIHGGSIRVYIKKEINKTTKVDTDSIKWLLELEKDLGLHTILVYLNFSHNVRRIKDELLAFLKLLKDRGKIIMAYGASAKGTVLLNYCGIGKDYIDYIIDDTPEKQGYFAPGTHIPIVDSSYLKSKKPDYLLLLAWNFAEELIVKTQDYKNSGGRYIIPIPDIMVI